MAVNLHTKYEKALAMAFTKESVIEARTSNKYSFTGYKTIRIPSIVTKPLVDYTRSGSSRFGTLTDVQDTVQEMTLTLDKGFTMAIDAGDNSEQQMMKSAAEVMRAEIREQVTPTIDKRALAVWAVKAGKVRKEATSLSKSNIITYLLDAETTLNNAFIPTSERYAYIPYSFIPYLRTATEFTGCDKITDRVLIKGDVGRFATFDIVGVPDSWMPTDVNFLIAHKSAVLQPKTLTYSRIHVNPVGVNGNVLEGRYIYDAFVLGAHANGVYTSVKSTGTVAADPTVTKGGSTTTIVSSGNTCYYTTDGSDPRYSTTVQTYSSAIDNLASGGVLKSYAMGATGFPSAVVVTTF